MTDCVCGCDPPDDPNPDCERCQLVCENKRLREIESKYDAQLVTRVVLRKEKLDAEVDRLQRSIYDIRLVASDEDAVLSLCDEAIGEDEGE